MLKERRPPFFLKKEFISMFLLGVMVLSALGIYGGNDTNGSEVKYNEYRFFPLGSGWVVNINGIRYQFRYLPSELESLKLGNFPKIEKVYLAYDPTSKNFTLYGVTEEVMARLGQFGVNIVPSCVTEEDCPGELPIVNCKQSSAPILFFKRAEETKIDHDGACIVLYSPSVGDLYKIIEKIEYQWIGVMKNE